MLLALGGQETKASKSVKKNFSMTFARTPPPVCEMNERGAGPSREMEAGLPRERARERRGCGGLLAGTRDRDCAGQEVVFRPLGRKG